MIIIACHILILLFCKVQHMKKLYILLHKKSHIDIYIFRIWLNMNKNIKLNIKKERKENEKPNMTAKFYILCNGQ